eukprot:1890488-Amphidinium_carterae.1
MQINRSVHSIASVRAATVVHHSQHLFFGVRRIACKAENYKVAGTVLDECYLQLPLCNAQLIDKFVDVQLVEIVIDTAHAARGIEHNDNARVYLARGIKAQRL